MKRIIALLFCLIMAFSVAACTGNNPGQASKTEPQKPESGAGKEDVSEKEAAVDKSQSHDSQGKNDVSEEKEVVDQSQNDHHQSEDDAVIVLFQAWLDWFAGVDLKTPKNFSSRMEGEAYTQFYSASVFHRKQVESMQSQIKSKKYSKLFIWDDSEDHVYIGAVWQDGPSFLSMFTKTSGGLVMTGERPPEKYHCHQCNGQGRVVDSVGTGSVCSICGGTGVQWQQEQYYDAIRGWQTRQYTVACAGCAGTGYVGGTPTTYKTCPHCLGLGYAD